MAITTDNLGLIKPEPSDNMDVTVLADNFGKIDEAVGTINETLSESMLASAIKRVEFVTALPSSPVSTTLYLIKK